MIEGNQPSNFGFIWAASQLRNNWIARRMKEFFFYKDSPQDVYVLDVGSGQGYLTKKLANQKYNVTGIDISEANISKAKEWDSTSLVTYLRGDIQTLPFADETFDAVTCLDILEHVDDPKRVLSEIQRVLKPNGFFFFHCYNNTLRAKLIMVSFVRWFFKEDVVGYESEKFIPPKVLSQWMMDVGLHLIESHGLRPKIFQFALLKSLFRRRIQPNFEFTWSNSKSISYCGAARKIVCSISGIEKELPLARVKTE